jgi:16S rRNA G966 N2-methylase RsmD
MLVRLKQDVQEDGWLEHDAVYPVLGISVQGGAAIGGPLKYRLITRQEPDTPAFHDATLFDILDPKVSPRWVVTAFSDGKLGIEPEAWSDNGFWAAFFDGDPKAREQFQDEYARLAAEAEVGVRSYTAKLARDFPDNQFEVVLIDDEDDFAISFFQINRF